MRSRPPTPDLGGSDGLHPARTVAICFYQRLKERDWLRDRRENRTRALFAIVYPANRIVIDYGALEDLVLVGAVDIATGRSLGPATVPGWPGPVVELFEYSTLAEALAAPPRDNR